MYPVGTSLNVDINSFVLHLYIIEVVIQGLFGVLLFVYVPILDPYLGYNPLRKDVIENTEYEELPGTKQICSERHVNILSTSFHIVIAMILLYRGLGVASIVGLCCWFFCSLCSKMQKLAKEGFQHTDKRIGLMNEILAAMDTVK